MVNESDIWKHMVVKIVELRSRSKYIYTWEMSDVNVYSSTLSLVGRIVYINRELWAGRGVTIADRDSILDIYLSPLLSPVEDVIGVYLRYHDR